VTDQSLLNKCPIVPVVVIHDLKDAIPLGEALLAGGIDIAEITLRTSEGLGAIAALQRHCPKCMSGPVRS